MLNRWLSHLMLILHYSRRWLPVTALVFLGAGWAGVAGEEERLTPISAETVAHLAPGVQIPFTGREAELGTIGNGWFVSNADGDRLAVVNMQGEVLIINDSGHLLDRYRVVNPDGLPLAPFDAMFDADGVTLVAVHPGGDSLDIVARQTDRQTNAQHLRLRTADIPLRVWVNEAIWLEMEPTDYLQTRYVLRIPSGIDAGGSGDIQEAPLNAFERLPSGPENDPEAYLRIGRIEGPFALTITAAFELKRWDMETAGVTAQVNTDALPAVGSLTTDGRWFGWRDGQATGLWLTDLDTGENRRVVQQQKWYVPFLLLNQTADVMIGVNIDLEPVVVAWVTRDGQRVDLGEYGLCNRQPDMVRLNARSTQLVIGCAQGLEIWRVEEQHS